MIPILLLLLVFCSACCAQGLGATGLNPLGNFCSRWNHQSQIKNGMLFIDGGVETFSGRSSIQYGLQPNWTGPITAGPNDYIIAVNMSAAWDWQHNISEVAINKSYVTVAGSGAFAPTYQRAALFQGRANDSNVYLYGGSSPDVNTSFPGYQWPYSSEYTLWGFNTITHAWTQHDVYAVAPERPSWGAYAEVPELNLAFYLNGIITNYSSPADDYLANNTLYLEGMVVLDLANFTATNFSTEAFNNGNPAAGGQMVYIPNYGSDGVLLHFGGSSGKSSQPQPNVQAVTTLTSMSTVSVFDVGIVFNASDLGGQTGGWYTQGTSGAAVPAPRVDFCVWLATAPDNSSVNIYMYGGWDPTQSEKYFDEIWVLTLPSFTWIQVYNGTAPRFRHTCHALGSGQAITVGGQRYADWSRECDWEYKSVAIYNLNQEQWGSIWNPDLPEYQVPSSISKVVGGGPNGGAMKLRPDTGWESMQMAMLFTGTNDQTAPANAGVSDSAPHGLSKGVIAAIAVASAFTFVALSLGVGWLVWYRRRGRNRVSASSNADDANRDDPQGEMRPARSVATRWTGWEAGIRP